MLGDRLKEARKRKNITQEELATMCKVAKTTVSNWENNITEPPYETLKNLARILDVSIHWLLDFNHDDINSLEKLKTAIKEAGMWDYDIDDMNKEDFEKAIQIMNMLKDTKN